MKSVRNDNKILVNHFIDKVKNAGSVFISGFQGMTEEEINDLRLKLDSQAAEYRVMKNSIFRVVSEKSGYVADTRVKTALKGQNSFTIGGKDLISVAKVIADYEKGNQKFVIKGGYLNGKYISAEEVKALASLPSRSELIAKVVGSIAAPLSNLVGVLNASVTSIVRVINSIKEKKESESK